MAGRSSSASATPPSPSPWGTSFPEGVATRASVYVYVEDADATYGLAIRNGATPISPPEDKPYRERAGGVRDDFGNVWYISTYLGGT